VGRDLDHGASRRACEIHETEWVLRALYEIPADDIARALRLTLETTVVEDRPAVELAVRPPVRSPGATRRCFPSVRRRRSDRLEAIDSPACL